MRVGLVARLRELEGRATAGPWAYWSHVGQPRVDSLFRSDGVFPPSSQGVRIGGVNATSTRREDSELIAAMHNALPALLRVAEAARAVTDDEANGFGVEREIAALRAALDELDRPA